jgi:hypothetical protein
LDACLVSSGLFGKKESASRLSAVKLYIELACFAVFSQGLAPRKIIIMIESTRSLVIDMAENTHALA